MQQHVASTLPRLAGRLVIDPERIWQLYWSHLILTGECPCHDYCFVSTKGSLFLEFPLTEMTENFPFEF
jgi:hypothetical protein